MSQQNINNAGAARKSIQATNSQVTHIKAPEKVAENKPAFKADLSEHPSGPAVLSGESIELNSSVNHGLQRPQDRLNDLDIGFGFDDDEAVTLLSVDDANKAQLTNAIASNYSSREGESIDFALSDNDQQSILVDRNPNSESHNIVQSTLLDTEAATDLDFFSNDEAQT